MVSAPGIAVEAPAPAPRRGRRWLRRAVAAVVVVVVLVVAVAAGIAWYFSGVALAVDHTVDYGLTVRSVALPSAGPARLELPRNADTAAPGTLALVWPGGHGLLGPVVSSGTSTVTREFTPGVGGTPASGTRVRTDSYAYLGDPATAVGLPFSDVRVPGPLGPLPGWYLPAPGLTWVVFVHGHDADRQEALRYLRTWHDLGLPVLVPTYRDDVGAPSSPDGFHHLGDTEWQDVAAAVRWAHGHGAADVILAGWSMGGAIALQTVDRSDVAGLVRGLLLDSPVIDWRNVFATQGADRGLPGPEVTLAEWVLQWRAGISLDRLDWVSRANRLRVPTLIFHSDSDGYVPDGPAVRLAAARPELVTLVRVPGARHTMDWNVDPSSYNTTMTGWLAHLGVPLPPVPR
jgi:pimeloyl-ACP methyl ester carboxylesterase